MIVVQSVLSAIYQMLKYTPLIQCIPRSNCISAILKVTSHHVNTLRILAKAVLSLIWPYLTNKQKESVVVDSVEIQTFLNCHYGRPCLNHTVVLPICNYMEDVMVSGENRLAFLQHLSLIHI